MKCDKISANGNLICIEITEKSEFKGYLEKDHFIRGNIFILQLNSRKECPYIRNTNYQLLLVYGYSRPPTSINGKTKLKLKHN